jgi:hypothetical protein
VLEGYAQHGPRQPFGPPPQTYPMPALKSRGQTNNPIYDPAAHGPLNDSRPIPEKETEEFVPTYDIRSEQSGVDEESVAHIAEHGTGLREPNVLVSRSEGTYGLWDGNHRVNAALRRGQLLTPADVIDYDEEYGT